MNYTYHDSELQRRIRSFIDSSRQEIISDLSDLIRIQSFRGDPEPNAPFGPGLPQRWRPPPRF